MVRNDRLHASRPRSSVMPKGVEHTQWLPYEASGVAARSSVMPKGVEHYRPAN